MIDHLITFQFSIAITLDAFCRNILYLGKEKQVLPLASKILHPNTLKTEITSYKHMRCKNGFTMLISYKMT